MIVLHHLENSRSQRILWLLEELQLPYEFREYRRDPVTLLAPPQLLQIHPLGKSPVITDGAEVVAESGAIIEYLLERYGEGRLIPAAGTPGRLRYRYWLHYAEGSLMPLLLMQLVFARVATATPWLLRPLARAIAVGANRGFIAPNLARHFRFVESQLQQDAWFAGEQLSGADIQMSYPLLIAQARSGEVAASPGITRFLAQVQARPAWQRAVAKGGALASLDSD